MNNEDILKENGNKRWDCILMNPPFNMGVQFFEKTLEIADKVITIQPSNWLFGNTKKKSLIKKLKDVYVNIERYKEGYGGGFNVGLGNELSINYINNIENKKILIDCKEYNNLEDIKHYSDDELITEFNNIIKPLYSKDNVKEHILEYEIGEIIDDNDWCCKIPEVRGHRGAKGVTDDFYSIISPNDKFTFEFTVGLFKNIKQTSKKSNLKYYIKLDSKNAAYNIINYFKTDFVRGLLFISKMNIAVANGPTLRYIPWFNFSDEHFNKSPREIDDWLFKKYNISDKIREHIEEILPDYYNRYER